MRKKYIIRDPDGKKLSKYDSPSKLEAISAFCRDVKPDVKFTFLKFMEYGYYCELG